MRFTRGSAGLVKIGRNDPCPCGSGRKYKLCCGAVAVIAAAPVPPSVAPTGDAPGTTRQCGTCTACCEGWAEGEIRGHRMHPGRHCHFLTEGRCTIYAERPQSPCRNFVCGWLMPGSPFPDAFRPDKVGVIIVPMRWHDRPAFVLLSAGRDPDAPLLDWMRRFAAANTAPFFYQQDGQRIGYGPPAFQQEMQAKLARGERLW